MKKELLYKFFEGSTSLEEEYAIRKWIESSEEHRSEFYRERKLYDAMTVLPSPQTNQKEQTKPRRHTLWPEFIKIAAVVVLTLAIGTIYQKHKENSQVIAMQTITVPAGQYINIGLPDGSQVWLNARTTISYPVDFREKERTILLNGEAYFEVAPKKDQPFIVKTEKYNVEVLGTKFNVEAYKEKGTFATTLMHGKVRIHSSENPKAALILMPDRKAVLETGKLVVHKVDDYNPYRWREGLICFKNASFSAIMEAFEKYYGLKIHIKNQQVNKYNYTGKFRQTNGVDYALHILQKEISFKYKRDDNLQTIYIE